VTQDRDWSESRRLFFWLKTASLVIPIAVAVSAAFVWGYTRASIEYVDKADTKVMMEVQTKEPIIHAQEMQVQTNKVIEAQREAIKEQQKILSNVRDNVLLLVRDAGMPIKKLDADE